MNPAFAVGLGVIWLLQILACLTVLLRKQSAHAALVWVLVLLLLPGPGLLFFVAFGRRRLPPRLIAKVRHDRRFGASHPDHCLQVAPESHLPMVAGVDRTLRGLDCPPPRPDNRVWSLDTGEAAFAAIMQAIGQARHHVHVEEYIFKDEGLGERILALLEARARQGVSVRVLVDAIGTTAAWRILKRIRAAGGQAEIFLPVFPFGRTLTINWRNHRKIIVVDDHIAFVGGMNVGDEYFGRRIGPHFWSDAHLRLEGPAVADLARLFAQDWSFARGVELPLSVPDRAPPEAPGGLPTTVQIVPGGPDQQVNAVRAALLAALSGAEREIRIASPYLVPDSSIRDLLATAARRGLRVQLVTQGVSEVRATWLGSRFYWEALMAAGVEIYAYNQGILHTKLFLVDGCWAAVGSANLDARSLGLNFEVLALLDGPQAVDAIGRRFDQDVHQSERVDLARFRQRPWAQRLSEALARLLSPLL